MLGHRGNLKTQIGRNGSKLVVRIIHGLAPVVPLHLRHGHVAHLEHRDRAGLRLRGDNHRAVGGVELLGHRRRDDDLLQLVVIRGRRAETDGADVEDVGRGRPDLDWDDVSLHG